MVAVSIWNTIDWADPVPEIVAVNCAFNVPCEVLEPIADTKVHDENEQVVLGKLKYYDNDTDGWLKRY